jgi:hypothetical protein
MTRSELEVDATSFDALDALAGHPNLLWLNVDLCTLTKDTGDLTIYFDAAGAVGPRDINGSRGDVTGQLHNMAGTQTGGQLAAAIRRYFRSEEGVPSAFLSSQIPTFFLRTRWPHPFGVVTPVYLDFAMDVAARGRWETATAAEWRGLVAPQILSVLRRQDMARLWSVFSDHDGSISMLLRDLQRVGDVLLPGTHEGKLVLWRLAELQEIMELKYGDMIDQERSSGDTDSIVRRLLSLAEAERASQGVGGGSGHPPPEDSSSVPIVGPKRAQVARALAAASYVELETQYLEVVRDTSRTNEMLCTLLADCFSKPTVLPNAVLLNTRGSRQSVFTDASEFLALLHDLAPSMAFYLGQSLAYDPADELAIAVATPRDDGMSSGSSDPVPVQAFGLVKGVPPALREFELSAAQTRLFCDLRWTEMDPLNGCVLPILGKTAGTVFATHDASRVYHDTDMIAHVTTYMGRLYICIGYPKECAPPPFALSHA